MKQNLLCVLAVFLITDTQLRRDCLALETISSVWNVVDVGEGMKPAMDIDAADNIHLMAFTPTSGNVLYDSAPSIAGPWNLQSVASGGFYAPGGLVVDSNGTSHMAWHNHGFDGGSPNHLTVSSTGTVDDFPIVAPGHDGWDNALAVDSAGVVHQSSINPSAFGAADGLEYGKFNGSDWPGYGSIVGTGQVMYGFATALDTDSNNFAHMVYSQATAFTGIGDLNYVQDSAGGFSITTIVDDGISRFASIAIDSQDRPHVAWLEVDQVDTSTGSVMYGVLENNSWTIDTVDASIANLNIASGRKQVSLVLDGNDQPHFAYGEQRSINYATKATSVWSSTTLASSDENLYNGLVILRLNSLEQPTIAFFNASNLVRLAKVTGLLGDMNQDGNVTVADSPLFVEALVDPVAYVARGFPFPADEVGDVNEDGRFDLGDLSAFSALTFSGSASASTVPEPSTVSLGVLFLLMGIAIRQRRRV